MKKTKTLTKPVFWIVYAAVIAAAVAIDQLTKHYIGIATDFGKKNIPLIGDWLLFHWTENDGATGGIFQNLAWRNTLFFVMTVVGLPVFGFMLKRSRTRSVLGQVAFAFIIGGTLGNAIDRLFLAKGGFFTGAVRDFVQVTWFFGIFNAADSFLVVGVFLALLAIIWLDNDSLINSIREERSVKFAESSRKLALEAASSVSPLNSDNVTTEDTTVTDNEETGTD